VRGVLLTFLRYNCCPENTKNVCDAGKVGGSSVAEGYRSTGAQTAKLLQKQGDLDFLYNRRGGESEALGRATGRGGGDARETKSREKFVPKGKDFNAPAGTP